VGVYFSGATAPTCLYTVPTLTPKRRATSLTRTSGSLSNRTDLLLVAGIRGYAE
jgi:hypothetical protein